MSYLIWSNQHGAWWRPNERGYTQSIDEAGRYPRSIADRIVATATCDGQLLHTRTDPFTGEGYEQFDEVLVLAPESATDTSGPGVIVARDGGRYCEVCEGEIQRGHAYQDQPGTGGLLEHIHCPDQQKGHARG